MNVWNVIRGLSVRQIFRLARIMIWQPLLIYPTLKATRQTMRVCNLLYQKAHHKNGKPNAFRHGLWNLLICQGAYRVTKNREKSMIWAKKITDLHENLAFNHPLETAMDLHNNEIGRAIFYTMIGNSEEEMIAFLKKITENAKKVIDSDKILDHKNDLIYLSED